LSLDLFGNVQGLNRLAKRRLKNLYRKREPLHSLVTVETARQLLDLSKEIGRQVGILVTRRGTIEYVIVGDRERIKIPKLSSARLGRARFRGLRLIHTHLNGELLTKEDLTDLALLQLDLVACLSEDKGLGGEVVHVGYLVPQNRKDALWDFLGPMPVKELHIDFMDFINDLEDEFVKARGFQYEIDGERERCLVVSVPPREMGFDLDEHLAELAALCESAGVEVKDVVIQRIKQPDPRFLIGKGKLEETIIRSQQMGIDLLLFDRELSPSQIRNISSITELKVVDRNQLILDIFARRAKTKEAKIQVELAQLRYILPRLGERDVAFSRLTGGIGGRGPGETKLELDRRRIKQRISYLEEKLEEIRFVRARKREKRKASSIPVVSIVGYTNSGKSTLLNVLTGSSVETGERPFSTLNPTSRLIRYPYSRSIILTDTVGFIRNLPSVLLEAFLATLEELNDADLLIHLVDASDKHFEEKIVEVDRILSLLKITEKKKILVFNKIDRVDRTFIHRLEERFDCVAISCLRKEGLVALLERIEREIAHSFFPVELA